MKSSSVVLPYRLARQPQHPRRVQYQVHEAALSIQLVLFPGDFLLVAVQDRPGLDRNRLWRLPLQLVSSLPMMQGRNQLVVGTGPARFHGRHQYITFVGAEGVHDGGFFVCAEPSMEETDA